MPEQKLCGEARAEATASVQEVHKVSPLWWLCLVCCDLCCVLPGQQMLLRLLPEVPEAGGEDYSRWLDKLEAQGQEYLLAKAREVCESPLVFLTLHGLPLLPAHLPEGTGAGAGGGEGRQC